MQDDEGRLGQPATDLGAGVVITSSGCDRSRLRSEEPIARLDQLTDRRISKITDFVWFDMSADAETGSLRLGRAVVSSLLSPALHSPAILPRLHLTSRPLPHLRVQATYAPCSMTQNCNASSSLP